MTRTSTTPEHRALIAGVLLPGFAGTRMPDWVARELTQGLAGVCLFGANIESGAQLRELTASIRHAHPGAVIALDEEGGDVTRLHYDAGSPYPGNAVLGRLNDPGATYASAAAIGNELQRAGCNLDLAPSVDINSNPDNPVIGVRSFGEETALVAGHSAAWVRGLQSAGVAACAKHFPGHGDTAQDSHLMLPSVEADLPALLARELEPFRAVIAAGVASIMTSHILVPALDPENPATFSRTILQDLLRDQLGFTGVVVTDALDMKGASAQTGIPVAAARALAAGADLLCLGSDTTEAEYEAVIAAVLAALASGDLPLSRLEEAGRRVARLLDQVPLEGGRDGHASEPLVDAARVSEAFRLNGRAETWLRSTRPFRVEQISSAANMAVGHVPWGPAALEDGHDPDSPIATIDAARRPAYPAGARVALVGRNLHLNPDSVQLIEHLREQEIDLMVIEMGWPSAGAGIADACTFGASRLISSALLQLLRRGLPQGAE